MVQALLRCHQENPKMKFLGVCSNAKAALDICFRVRCSHLSLSLSPLFSALLSHVITAPSERSLPSPHPLLVLLVPLLRAPLPARLYTRRAR